MKKKEKTNLQSSLFETQGSRGITLIALVVTIVVLLILAGITITMLFGENGIIKKAQEAKEAQENATKYEKDGMSQIADDIDDKIANNNNNGENIKVSYTTSEESDWTTTVTLNVTLEGEEELTLEQKREIAAFLCDFSSYDEIIAATGGDLDNFLSSKNLTEEQFVNQIIEVGRKYINYSDTTKLESLGVKVISILTPYNSTLYTSNLGGEVKCSLTKNGTYNFKIKSGTAEKTETIIINNLRTAATQAPYHVNIESSTPFLYSVDETNTWRELTDGTVIECNNNIYIKFAEKTFISGTSVGYGLHYVEKNDEYYKYFDEENPSYWLTIRDNYFLSAILEAAVSQGWTLRRLATLYSFEEPSDNLDKVIKEILLNMYPRLPDFGTEFPEGLSYKVGRK